MTAEAQRIAIAEYCGFWDVHWYEDDAGPLLLVGVPPADRPNRLGRPDRHVPDYLNDLNAMQSAVLAQDGRFIKMFSTALSYRSSRTGKLFCEMKAIDWAEEFLEVKRDLAETKRHE